MTQILLNISILFLLLLGCSGSNSGSSSSSAGRSYVYALGNGSTNVFGYSVSSSGAMTAINTTTASAGHIGINLRAAPSKKFLYSTVNAGPPFKLVALEVNQATGATSLVAGGTANITDNNPSDLAIHPNSSIAYIPDSAANRVGIFTLDATTGVPTAAGFGAIVGGSAPNAVAIHPNGNFLYVVENPVAIAVRVYGITNTTTGALSAPLFTESPSGVSLYKAAISPDGKWLYVSGDSDVHAYSVDATTGAITLVESQTLAAGAAEGDSLTVDGSGKYLYVSCVDSPGAGTLKTFTINQATGHLEPLETVTPATAVAYSEVVADKTGNHVFLVDVTAGNLYSFNINPSTGVLAPVEEKAVAGGDPFSVTTLYFPP